MARNRLTGTKCARCQGTGEDGAMSICADCDGAGVEPTIPELRLRLSAVEAECSLSRERHGQLTDALATKLGHLHTQLRVAERTANGGK